jgi:hypothetical protein
MDMSIIEDSIGEFNDDILGETLDIIDDNFEFIDKYELYEPKKNYLFTLDFLNATIQNFSNLDYQFASETMRKLHRDIKNLHKLYTEHKESLNDLPTIFKRRFIPQEELFKEINLYIKRLKSNAILDDYDKETLQIMQIHYKKMAEIYYSSFKDDYIEQSKDILSSLEKILNTKICYLDKMLWRDSIKSEVIWRSLKMLKLDYKINSKKYLLYKLDVILPYTDEYQYLKKCLKVY